MNEYFDILKENGEYTNEIASRKECHEKGLWHKAAVVFIISNDNKRILLQKRGANKKLWPNLWDVSAGGHVSAGELGYQAVIRETKEELGIDIEKNSLEYIGTTISNDTIGSVINRHYNEYYIVHSDVKIEDIILQTEEVQDIKWFRVEEVLNRINNNYEGLTGKVSCWNYLVKYLEMTEIN